MKNPSNLWYFAMTLAIMLCGCATSSKDSAWPELGWGADAPPLSPVTNTVPEPVWPTIP